MPFNPIDFNAEPIVARPVQRIEPGIDPSQAIQSALMNAFNIYNQIQGMRQQRKESELNQQFKQAQLNQLTQDPLQQSQRLAQTYMQLKYPGSKEQDTKYSGLPDYLKSPEVQNRLAEQQKLTADLYKKFSGMPDSELSGQVAPGAIGQAMWLDRIKNQYGANSEVYQNALRSFQSEFQKTDALNKYRESLMGTIDKRSATQLSKTAQEFGEVKQGFLPGTGGKVGLTPEEQKGLLGQYELKLQKEVSDSTSRNKALFASNIDKTLEQFDPKNLVQYSGIKGRAQKSSDMLSSALGKTPERYMDYQKSLTSAGLLAKQIRQFYGDSITPQIAEKIEHIVNPSSWEKDSKVALAQFNELKSILKKETGTYKSSLKSTREYDSSERIPPPYPIENRKELKSNDPLGIR